ncbi:hypothetical protein [Polyangium jinanense]|uniref:hypothetical protein n=1 Tax=Polyangium jinanense TaxID=2829994 RepID=UPI002341454E|nr:hypothetical protein [Polyangium jinanense]
MRYFSEKLRRIEERPRTVVWSRELRAKELPEELRTALFAIEASSLAGLDLNPHLSKTIKKAGYNDMLLNDWGIHHMHLGPPSTGTDFFVGRRDELLFVWPTVDKLYFVDVLGHGHFSDDTLIETTHQNWPHLLEPYRCTDVVVPDPISSEERTLLRRPSKFGGGCLLAATTVRDGTVYFTPGGGYSVGGTNRKARDVAYCYLNEASRWQQWCKSNASTVSQWVHQRTGRWLPELRLSLQLLSDQMIVVETQTRARFSIHFGA